MCIKLPSVVEMGGWVGGASVTWHVFQSALSLQASHGPVRQPAAPAGRPPSLTPSSSLSTSSSRPSLSSCSLTVMSLDRFSDSAACRVEAAGTQLTHWSAGRPSTHSDKPPAAQPPPVLERRFLHFFEIFERFYPLETFLSFATNISDN